MRGNEGCSGPVVVYHRPKSTAIVVVCMCLSSLKNEASAPRLLVPPQLYVLAHIDEFESECLLFVERFLSTVNPKTDEEKLLQAAAQYLQRRAQHLSAQRSLVSDNFELRLKPNVIQRP